MTNDPLPTQRTERPARQTRGADAVVALAGAGYGALVMWAVVSGRSAGLTATPLEILYGPFGLIGAFLAFRTGARLADDRRRLAWYVLAAAALISAGAETAASAARDLGGLRALPTATGILLLSYVLTTVAAFLLPSPLRRSRDRGAFALEAAIVGIGGGMLIWAAFLRPLVQAPGVEVTLRSLAFARGAADIVVLLGVASLLMRNPRGLRRRTFLLLAASMGLTLIADATFFARGVHDLPYQGLRLAHYLVFILAAWAERRRLFIEREEESSLVKPIVSLPYAAAMVGCATVIGAVVSNDGPGLRVLAVPLVAIAGVALGRLMMAVSETLRLRHERAVLVSEARFRSLVQHAADMIYVVDSTWTITFASPSVPVALGYRTSHLVGSSVLDLIHPEDVPDAANRLRECLNDSARTMRGRWRVRRNDQTFLHTETVCANLMADENIRGIVLTTRDVTERTSLEAQLAHQAFHDPLTGLANRALFQDRVQHALARRRGEHGRLGVVFLDLDHFKAVNDKLGHAGGDALLRAAAQRIVSGLRAFDTAARLGGDEFAVLVDDIPRNDEVIQVAERIARQFREPFVFDGREITTSASVGVALATPSQSAEDLLRNADLAMYLAKSRGRGQAALFESGMHADQNARLELQRDLRQALERSEFSLAYQPIHMFDSQSIIGAEALIRWVHPTRGPIPPATFVPIAEEAGLMVEIGRWVLRKACMDAQGWHTRPGRGLPLRVWINLSGRQIPNGDLYDHVLEAIAESGILPAMIVLELTEPMLQKHEDQALELMHRLKALGVRLAIDDFGTGYSSLSRLQRLPIDILKIDRVFVDAIASDEHATALARTVVNLGESMSLQIIAEGIENAEQVERLQALGCDGGQGFFFGMPMSADDLADHAERARTFSEA